MADLLAKLFSPRSSQAPLKSTMSNKANVSSGGAAGCIVSLPNQENLDAYRGIIVGRELPASSLREGLAPLGWGAYCLSHPGTRPTGMWVL